MACFLANFFHNRLSWLPQLQAANNDLHTQMLDALDNVANAASQAMLAVATDNPHQCTGATWRQLTRNAKAADPETLTEAERKLYSLSDMSLILLSPYRLMPLLMRG